MWPAGAVIRSASDAAGELVASLKLEQPVAAWRILVAVRSVKDKGSMVQMRASAAALCLAGLCVSTVAMAADTNSIPNFAPDTGTSWGLDLALDDLLPPAAGPGPITFDPAHPYIPNFRGKQPTYRVADLTNPILLPWAREQMRKTNEEVLAGKVPFRARERCWPIGVPGFWIYSLVELSFFLQTPGKVTIINPGGPEVRQVYLDVPHSAEPKPPSWYGELVGHYEGGDTLVIDTIGLNDRTFIDNYRTPHTTKLHVVERLKIVDDGKAMQISIAVDDPGAFTTPWQATQRWKRVARGPLAENACNENNANYFEKYTVPTPTAERPDF